MTKEKLTVTSALPYANGPVHLGHVAGAYLPADIYVRFHKLIGSDVLFVCGSDEHGVPITLRAEKENVTPRTIVKRFHDNIKETFVKLNIQFDNFSGTSHSHNKDHAALARDFFMNLLKNDLIISRLADQLFCPKTQRFLADRFVLGTCPKCGNNEARGDECSACNAQYDATELINPYSALDDKEKSPLEVKSSKHWYLRLDVLQKELETWIESKQGVWKENVLNFVRSWLKEGLRERAITRDLYWGVPVPLNEAAGKVLYVWFDAPIGYISSTMQWAEKAGKPDAWKEYWQDPERKIVHFLGKDNIPFHSIIWPAMLIGQRSDFELPWQIPANEYLNFGIGGEEAATTKASTSKGNVVWADEALESFPADMLRYYLAANAPEKQDTMFTWRDFQSKCNKELYGVVGNLVNRILKFTESNFESKIPEAGSWSDKDKEFLDKIKAFPEKVAEHYRKFEVRAAVMEIMNLGREGNQYFDEKAPWKSIKNDMDACKTCIFVGAQLVQKLAVSLSPIVPDSAKVMWEQLGRTGAIESWDLIQEEVAAGHQIGAPKGIFDKVEDKVIVELEKKLAAAMEPKEKEAAPSEPKKENEVTFDDFMKFDFRIGEIIEAEKVPKAKKLLQLKVSFGSETRQVVAGIAESFAPEELVGKKAPFVTNLKPAKIRGLMSEAMMLCTDADGKIVLLNPSKDVPAGSTVR